MAFFDVEQADNKRMERKKTKGERADDSGFMARILTMEALNSESRKKGSPKRPDSLRFTSYAFGQEFCPSPHRIPNSFH
jgi:hypothetical protein